jgi:hypothetical protein
MTGERLSARQRDLLAASAAVASRGRREVEEAGLRPPEPGDVFVLAATADWPVEWALLDRPQPAGPFLAVAGDSHPFLGSDDVEAETSAGPLHLRCRSRVRLDSGALDPARRVARLSPFDLEQARQKVREIDGGESGPESLLEEIDTSSAYREWLREVVEPARAAAGERVSVLPFGSPAGRRTARRRVLYAAAATLFVVVGAGLAGRAVFEQRRADRLATEWRRSEAALAATRRRQQEEQMGVDAARRQLQAEVGDLRRRIAALEGGEATPKPLLNLPVAILFPSEPMRAAPADRPLVVDGPFLVLVLKFREPAGVASYRVSLTPHGKTSPTWSSAGLERSAQGAVQLALPRNLVPPGEYRLRLETLRAGQVWPLAAYELTVDSVSGGHGTQ